MLTLYIVAEMAKSGGGKQEEPVHFSSLSPLLLTQHPTLRPTLLFTKHPPTTHHSNASCQLQLFPLIRLRPQPLHKTPATRIWWHFSWNSQRDQNVSQSVHRFGGLQSGASFNTTMTWRSTLSRRVARKPTTCGTFLEEHLQPFRRDCAVCQRAAASSSGFLHCSLQRVALIWSRV